MASWISILKRKSDPLSVFIERSGRYDAYELFLCIFLSRENHEEMADALAKK